MNFRAVGDSSATVQIVSQTRMFVLLQNGTLRDTGRTLLRAGSLLSVLADQS